MRKFVNISIASFAVISIVVAPIIVLAAPISVLQFGTAGTGNGQFATPAPMGVDVDSSGNIYVADAGNDRIQKFDSTGAYVTQFGTQGTGNGQFNAPFDIAVNIFDQLFVADTDNSRIQKFDSSGNYISQFGTVGSADGEFDTPFSVLLSSLNAYVSDSNNQRIQIIDTSNGSFVSKFGTVGVGNGQFGTPVNGSVEDSLGNIYVTDTGGKRIQKFTSGGVYISEFGTAGTGNGQFDQPYDVAIDSSGNIYVADAGNDRIQKFNSSGVYVSQFGSSGSSVGQLNFPTRITIDSSDNIFVADTSNNRIQKFSDTVPVISNPVNSYSGRDRTPEISGTCITGMVVTVYVDGSAISPTATCSGSSFSVTPSSDLTTGAHTLTATQSDPGGNESSASTSVSITITASGGGAFVIKIIPQGLGQSAIKFITKNYSNITNTATLVWSDVINVTGMSFSTNPQFNGAGIIPFVKESVFNLAEFSDTINLYGRVYSSTGDFIQYGPVILNIKKKINIDKSFSEIKPSVNAGCPAKYPAFTSKDLYEVWPTKNIQWLLNEEVKARIHIDGRGGVTTKAGIISYKKKYQSEIGLTDKQTNSSFIDSVTLAHMNAKLCAK